MLTDKHTQMAQELLLHQQFPLIEGLWQPSTGKVQQFPVVRQEFIQGSSRWWASPGLCQQRWFLQSQPG